MSEEIAKYNELSGVISPNGFEGKRKLLLQSADLEDTLKHIKRIAIRDAYQVKDLAYSLKGDSIGETAQNIWDYLRENTRYKLDQKGKEELRTPARSLVDGEKGLTDERFGIDCDDYTILISSLLINLGIKHEYRVAAYKEKGKFQHIYPVARDEYGEPLIIDVVPEIPSFNYEAKPIIDLKIVLMELHELSGIGEIEVDAAKEVKEDLQEALNEPFSLAGVEDENDDELEAHFLNGLGEVDTEEEADIVLNGADIPEMLDRGLLAEINKARKTLLDEKKNPTPLSQLVDVNGELKIMEEVMESWGDDREEAIEEAIEESKGYKNFYKSLQASIAEIESNTINGVEEDEPIYLKKMNLSEEGFAELLEDDSIDGLGRRRRGRLKKFFKKVGNGVKKGIRAVVRYNPATIAMRSAILLILKTNAFNIAGRLIYGYITESQARAKGMNVSEWKKLVRTKGQVEKYYKRVGGRTDKFKRAIIKGRAAKKTGLQLRGDLGVVVTASTAAAAGGFLTFVKKLLKKVNPANLFQKNSASNRQERTQQAQVVQSFSPQTRSMQAPNQTIDDTTQKTGFIQKIKTFFTTHKKKIIIVGVGGVVALVALIAIKKIKKKRKRSLAGVKAARTRKRNAKKTIAKRSTSTTRKRRKTTRRVGRPVGKGSTTIIRVPSKSIKKTRVSRRSNASRLKAMHAKAKKLQKQHPRAKYSSLLKKASKMI